MSKFIVTGGERIAGACLVAGAKNAALPIMAACVLLESPVWLRNCPCLTDVENMAQILRLLGCRVVRDGQSLFIDATDASSHELPEHLTREMRSSIFLLGPVLARFRRAVVAYPGGCEIGNRPIDLHLKGLAALNARIVEEGGRIVCDGRNLIGAPIHLDYPSVGATENIMLAATAAKGETVIKNAAREPEIVDLQDFLSAAGFCVRGAGSSTISITGGRAVRREIDFGIMPDRIVAGTLLTAAAVAGGEITLLGANADHMTGTLAKLTECGCRIRSEDDGRLHCRAPERPKAPSLIETLPYPGFPTDMQAQMFALMTVADGTGVIVENVFENRFKHAQELACMGGVSCIRGRTAIIRGVKRLQGAEVFSRDLRGGAALVLAALRAEGVTTVHAVEHIDRGYDKLEETLCALGARIRREES